MTKEYLEALERLAMPDELHIEECKKLGIGLTEDYDILKQYFESIDNAKSSEALECLNEITLRTSLTPASSLIRVIKQALLKAQEQEKVLEIIFEKNVDIWVLKESENLAQYNFSMTSKKYNIKKMGFKTPVSYLEQEEFDLLKRWLDGQKLRNKM